MKIFFILGLSSIDPFLGRVDKSSISQETLMELLIDKISNKEIICGSTEEPKELSEWEGVYVNEKEEVELIEWPESDLVGSIPLEVLPLTVIDLLLSYNELSGTIHLENLPSSLVRLFIDHNQCTGTVNLKELPEKLKVLSLYENQLSGSIDLTSLPSNIQRLYLNGNGFSGETDFSKLPESFKWFDVSDTQLSGEIHLSEGQKAFFEMRNSNVKVCLKE